MSAIATKRGANRFMLIFLCYMLATSLAIAPLLSRSMGIMTLQSVMELVSFLTPALAVAVMYRREARGILSLRAPGFANIALVIGMSLFIQPLTLLLGNISALFFADRMTDFVTDGLMGQGFAAVLIGAAAAPAICEEAVSRGVFLYGYRNAPLWLAAAMNGLFFGLLHMNPQQFLYTFALGALLAVFVRLSGSIVTSVVAHFVLNGTQVSMLYLSIYLRERLGIAADAAAADVSAWDAIAATGVMTAFTLPFFGLLMWLFVRNNRRADNEREQREETDEPYEPDDIDETDEPVVTAAEEDEPAAPAPKDRALTVPLALSVLLYLLVAALTIAAQYIYGLAG